MNFIERNTRTAYRIERLQREGIAEYPMAAIREAITNAVMHRDWFNEGANVFVEIYDDRIEITSPGGLPKGLHASDLGRRSVRRNPLIADLLHRIAFIEKAGTGIRRMRADAREHRCPSPAFAASTFFTTRYMLPLLAAGWLAMTIPKKPRSSKQRYVVTPEGEDALSAFSQVANDEER